MDICRSSARVLCALGRGSGAAPHAIAGKAPRTLGDVRRSRRRPREAIANPAHRLDVLARALELVAQALHVSIDGAGGDAHIHSPDAVEEHPARLHAIAVLVEREQQLPLEQGELDLLLVDPDPMSVLIDAQAAKGHRPHGRHAVGAAQHRLHAQHELSNAEGLDDVVRGAHLEAHDAIDLSPRAVTKTTGMRLVAGAPLS